MFDPRHFSNVCNIRNKVNYNLLHASNFDLHLVNSFYNGTESISFLGPQNLRYITHKVKVGENSGIIQKCYFLRLCKCYLIGVEFIWYIHYVKSVRNRSYSSPHFPAFGLNTVVRNWENADQNNSEYRNFSRNDTWKAGRYFKFYHFKRKCSLFVFPSIGGKFKNIKNFPVQIFLC